MLFSAQCLTATRDAFTFPSDAQGQTSSSWSSDSPRRCVLAYACSSIPVSCAESEAYAFLMDTDVVAVGFSLMELP